MATTTSVVINIDSSILTLAEQALCWKGGFATVSGPNAKQQIINYTLRTIAEYQNYQAQQVVTPPVSSLIS